MHTELSSKMHLAQLTKVTDHAVLTMSTSYSCSRTSAISQH